MDPGTAATGYGVVARARDGALSLRECGVIRPRRGSTLAERLGCIFRGVNEVLDRHAPEAMAVEGIFHGKNARTAVVLAHARGSILLAAALREIAVAEYPPAEVKHSVVGTGRADKAQVGYMVQRLLRLSEPPRPADAADGIAVALCHCFRTRGAGAARSEGFSLRELARTRGVL